MKKIILIIFFTIITFKANASEVTQPIITEIEKAAEEAIEKATEKSIEKGTEKAAEKAISKGIGTAAEIGITLGLFIGQAYTEQLFTEEEMEKQKQIFEKIKALQKEISKQKKDIQEKTNKKVEETFKAFKEGLDKINIKPIQEKNSTQLQYIIRLQSLSTAAPKNYLASPVKENISIQIDEHFAKSKMFTPKGATWHNVFPIGNWLYNPDLDAFIQTGAPPSTIWYNIKNNLENQLKNDIEAENNIIFTELYTNKTKYNLEVEIDLLSYTYPFLTGIIFNKARWLSGSLERIKTYRMIGIYGTDPTKVGVYIGQTTGLFDPREISSPIKNLLNRKLKPIYLFNKFDEIKNKKFLLKISIEQDKVIVTLTDKKSSEKLIDSKSINFDDKKENQLTFRYSSIGLISPGCQSMFRIINQGENEPTSKLIYTQDAIKEFKNSMGGTTNE